MNNVSSNVSCDQFSPHQLYQAHLGLENYVMPIFLSLTSLVGIAGNSTVIFIIFCKSGMRTVPNMLIVNLSFGDMVFIFGHMWFSIPSYVLGHFYGGMLLCRLTAFIKLSTLGVSIFTLTFMAMDRCRAITKPLHLHVLSKISVISIMIAIWIMACVASIPNTVMTRTQELYYMLNNTCNLMLLCRNDHENSHITTWVGFCLYFVIPFMIISVCYVAISITLFKSQAGPCLIQTNNVNANVTIFRRQMSARKRLSIVVLALVAIFVICRLPYESHAIYVMQRYESIHLWSSVATVLLYLYSVSNPLILYILSPTFRRFMVRIWCGCIVSSATPIQEHTMPISATQVVYTRINRSPSS